jgi:hypothetical protein
MFSRPRWTADSSQRPRWLQRVLFPEGVEYEDGAYRTGVTWLLFMDLHADQMEKEEMVALTGIEPVFED